MGGFDDHRHPFGLETGLNEIGYLLGQALLDLRSFGEQIDYPGQL